MNNTKNKVIIFIKKYMSSYQKFNINNKKDILELQKYLVGVFDLNNPTINATTYQINCLVNSFNSYLLNDTSVVKLIFIDKYFEFKSKRFYHI